MSESVVLLGLRGAGKTTVGRALAALLGLRFVDLDDEVAAAAGGVPAGEVLAREGEPAFRLRELAALRAALERAAADPAVLATGGGVVETEEARRLLLVAPARCVWLRAPVEVLRARLAADPTPRPALRDVDALVELEALAERREPRYRAVADLEVDASEGDPPAIAARIAALLSPPNAPSAAPPPSAP